MPSRAERLVDDREEEVRAAAPELARRRPEEARRSTEDALRASEERYRRFFEESLSGVSVLHPDGRLTACNPAFARIFAFASPEELVGANLLALVEDADALGALLVQVAAEGTLRATELELTRWDGRPLHLVASLVAERDDGGLSEITGYWIDVTERKLAEQQVLHTQRLESIGSLAGAIAHDLNNVLAPVLMSVDLLEDLVTDPRGRRLLASIERSSRRGMDLARQVLWFARGVEGERRAVVAGAAAEPEAPEPERGEGQLVLVVDDEPTIRDVCRETLEAYGYRALTAADGAEAVALFARYNGEVAAVLTDLAMPIMDGPSAIRSIRRLNRWVPILAMSGLADRHGLAEIGEHGISAFLAKPFSAEELLGHLREALALEPFN